MTLQVEESCFATPGGWLQKTAGRLLQLLSRTLACLDKTAPTRVRFQLSFQQDRQTVGNIVGHDDSLGITLFLPKRTNSRTHVAPMIGDDLHRHADLLADRVEVRC